MLPGHLIPSQHNLAFQLFKPGAQTDVLLIHDREIL
jgi:hypothetical protein